MAKLTVKAASGSRHRVERGGLHVAQFGPVSGVDTVYARYVGRVGALAVALGVGAAMATGQGLGLGVARAETGADSADSTHSADNQSDSADNQSDSADSAGTQTGESPSGPPSTGDAGPSEPANKPGSDSDGPPSGQTINNPSVPKMNQDNSGGLVKSDDDTADDGALGGAADDDGADGDDGADAGRAEEGNAAAPSTPPSPAASQTISAPTEVPPPTRKAPPSGPAPQGNSNKTQPTRSNTLSRSLVGQATVSSSDTIQRSLAPGAPSQSQSRLTNQDPAGLGPTGQHLVAASGAQSARTTGLASSQQDPVKQPGTVASIAKTVVATLLSPFSAPGPDAPAESPMLLAMLGWMRRETQRTSVTTTSTVKAQETTLAVDTVGELMALMAASTPSAAAPTAAALRRNFAPIALPDVYSTPEDTARTVAGRGVLGNDIDLNGDPLTAALVSAPKNGTVTLNSNGSFTYTPKANYSGLDSFTYRASDATTTSNVATVLVNVTAVNDPPIATPDTYSTAKGVKLTVAHAAGVLKNDVDPDGPLRQAQLVSRPSNGTLTFNSNGSFTYTPRANFSGTDTFTYRASDGKSTSTSTTVSIKVGNPNTAPVAVNDSYSTTEDLPLTIAGPGVLSNDTDAEANALTAAVVSNPGHGTLSLSSTGSFTYTPTQNYSGPDSFTYRSCDGSSTSNVATVNLTVSPVNDAPVANSESYTVNEDTPLTVAAPGVLANDSDIEGSALTAVLVDTADHGNLTLNANGSFTYTPAANYSGPDSFSYKANDSTTDGNTTTVTITVNEVPDVVEIVGEPMPQIGYTNGILTTADGKRVLQQTRSYDQATGVSTSVLTLIDVETGSVVGEPVVLPGYSYATHYDEDRRYLTIRDDVNGTSTFVVIDTGTGAVLGDPVTRAGHTYPRYNADMTRAYLIYSGSEEAPGSFAVVDTTTGAVLGSPVTGHVDAYLVDEVVTRVFVLDYDEGTDKTTISAVDTATGAKLREPIVLDGAYRYVLYSPDESRAYSYAYSESRGTGTLAIFNPVTGGLVGSPVSFDVENVYVYFSEDSKTGVVATQNYDDRTGSVTIVDMVNGRAIGTPLSTQGYVDVQISKDGLRVFASSGYGVVTVIDAATGLVLGERIQTEDDYTQIEFSEDGKRAFLITRPNQGGYYDRAITLRIVDTATGLVVGEPVMADAYGYDPTVQYSDDGSRVIVTAYELRTAAVYVVDTDTGAVVFERITGNSTGMEANDDGSRVFVFHYGDDASRSVEIIDTATGEMVRTPIAGSGVVVTDDGKRLYVNVSETDSDDTTLQIFDVVTGEALSDSFTVDGLTNEIHTSEDGQFDYVHSMRYEPDDYYRGTSTITVVDRVSGTPVDSFTIAGAGAQLDIREVGDRIYVFADSRVGFYPDLKQTTTVAVLDADTGMVLGTPITLDGEMVEPVFSDQGTRLFVVAYGPFGSSPRMHVAIIDTETGAPAVIPGMTDDVVDLRIVSSQPGRPRIFTIYTVDSAETPDYSTREMVILVGGDVGRTPVIMPGSGSGWFSADGAEFYMTTVRGEYTGTVLEPDTLTTYFTIIDVATGAARGDDPVAVEGRLHNSFDFYGAGVVVGDDYVYLTSYAKGAGGERMTRTTIVNRATGAAVGSVDVEGDPHRVVSMSPDDTRVLRMTESVDAAGEKTITIAVIDTATATLVGDPIAFEGAAHTVSFTADGSHALVVTQPGTASTGGGDGPGGGPGVLFHGPTTFTLVDTATGAVVGDPLTIDGTFGSWTVNLGEDQDRAYVTMYSRDPATNVYTYTTYVLDIDGSRTAF